METSTDISCLDLEDRDDLFNGVVKSGSWWNYYLSTAGSYFLTPSSHLAGGLEWQEDRASPTHQRSITWPPDLAPVITRRPFHWSWDPKILRNYQLKSINTTVDVSLSSSSNVHIIIEISLNISWCSLSRTWVCLAVEAPLWQQIPYWRSRPQFHYQSQHCWLSTDWAIKRGTELRIVALFHLKRFFTTFSLFYYYFTSKLPILPNQFLRITLYTTIFLRWNMCFQ